jgi:hypothetical protein
MVSLILGTPHIETDVIIDHKIAIVHILGQPLTLLRNTVNVRGPALDRLDRVLPVATVFLVLIRDHPQLYLLANLRR